MPHLQSQTPDTPDGAYPVHLAIRSGSYQLHLHGGNGGCDREACHEEHSGRRGSLHTLYPGVCHQ